MLKTRFQVLRSGSAFFDLSCSTFEVNVISPARLSKQLDSIDEKERDLAILEIGNMGAVALPACAKLFDLIYKEPEYIRVNSVRSILKVIESAQSDLAKLLPLLKHPNSDIRAHAVAAIGRGEQLQSFFDWLLMLTAMTASITSKETVTKYSANYFAIKNAIETDQKAMRSQLIPLLKDTSSNVRANAALAISYFEYYLPNTPELLPQLTLLLQDSERRVRINELVAIGSMVDSAKSVTPQILTLLKDPDPEIRSNAVFALFRIESLPKSLPSTFKSRRGT